MNIKINEQDLRWFCLASPREIMTRVGAKVIANQGGDIHGVVDRGAKVLAVAHLDTVFKKSDHAFFGTIANERWIFSDALDDRLGAYIIAALLPKLGIETDLLFTTNEEKTMSTAFDFLPSHNYNWIVEFDRARTDVVAYQYTETIETLLEAAGFKVGHGSYTDIVDLEHLGVAAFNVGVGYAQQHTLMCHANLEDTIKMVKKFVTWYELMKDEAIPYTPPLPAPGKKYLSSPIRGRGKVITVKSRRIETETPTSWTPAAWEFDDEEIINYGDAWENTENELCDDCGEFPIYCTGCENTPWCACELTRLEWEDMKIWELCPTCMDEAEKRGEISDLGRGGR